MSHMNKGEAGELAEKYIVLHTINEGLREKRKALNKQIKQHTDDLNQWSEDLIEYISHHKRNINLKSNRILAVEIKNKSKRIDADEKREQILKVANEIKTSKDLNPDTICEKFTSAIKAKKVDTSILVITDMETLARKATLEKKKQLEKKKKNKKSSSASSSSVELSPDPE